MRPALEAIGAKHNAKVKVVEVPPGPPVLSPIVAEIYGPDEAGRHALAKRVRAALGATDGVIGVDDSIEDNAPRALVRVDQRKAALAGVTPRDIVAALRVALAGDDVTSIHGGQAKYDIPVRLDDRPGAAGSPRRIAHDDGALGDRRQRAAVRAGAGRTGATREDALPQGSAAGDLRDRRHGGHDGQPAVRHVRRAWRGSARPRCRTAGTLAEYFIAQPADPYRPTRSSGTASGRSRTRRSATWASRTASGLILIYLLVVAQFKSYLTPLVIMAPIPLTIIGVMPGHAMMGAQFTATSMIGMIALAGIIVRNSILLVDFVNLQLAQWSTFSRRWSTPPPRARSRSC